MLERVMKTMANHHNFVVVSHVAPDGDSLGSILALCSLLRAEGKTATAVCLDHIPDKFFFLPGISEMVNVPSDLPDKADCLVVLDCGDLARTGVPQDYSIGKTVINIDHHRSNDGQFGIAWVDEGYAAAGEQVFFLAKHMEWLIGPEAAICLFTALATDTGFFRYSNTSARALRMAAELVELGVDSRLIAEQTMERRTLAEICLLKSSLNTLVQHEQGKISAMDIAKADCDRCGVSPEETDGLVEYPRGIPGTEVAVLFREVGPELIRISLRSRKHVDVSRVAREFGGGGHARAAGCTITEPLYLAKEKVLNHLKKELKEDG